MIFCETGYCGDILTEIETSVAVKTHPNGRRSHQKVPNCSFKLF